MNSLPPSASALVWNGLPRALPPHNQNAFLFLTPGDEQTARTRHFASAESIITAYLWGDSESTHDLQLVYVNFNDSNAYAGNAAYIVMREGWGDSSHAKFAPTAHAGKKLSNGDDSECLLLLMLRYQPHHTIMTQNRTPRLGTGNDVTTFMASQACWANNYGPPSAAALQPPVHHCRKNTVRFLYAQNRTPVLGSTGKPLREFDYVLPRRISSEITFAENRWLIAIGRMKTRVSPTRIFLNA